VKSVTLAEFNSPAEAESLHRRLIAAGIRAELRAESKVEKVLTFFRPTAGMRIEVPREDFEAAVKLVYDWNALQTRGGDELPIADPNRAGTPAEDKPDSRWPSA
jgi:hypothetical protein